MIVSEINSILTLLQLQQLHLDEPQRQPQPEPVPLANTIVSDVDESDDPLCSIEKMLEDTRPTYNNNIKTDIDANQSIITPCKTGLQRGHRG